MDKIINTIVTFMDLLLLYTYVDYYERVSLLKSNYPVNLTR